MQAESEAKLCQFYCCSVKIGVKAKSAESLSIEDAAARAGGAAASTEAEVATEAATEAG